MRYFSMFLYRTRTKMRRKRARLVLHLLRGQRWKTMDSIEVRESKIMPRSILP